MRSGFLRAQQELCFGMPDGVRRPEARRRRGGVAEFPSREISVTDPGEGTTCRFALWKGYSTGMENTPEPIESKNPFEKLPRRAQFLIAGAVILIALGAAYVIGSDAYYRVHPLGEAQDAGTPYGSEDNATGYEFMMSLLSTASSFICEQYDHGYQPAHLDNSVYVSPADTSAACGAIAAIGGNPFEHVVYFITNKYSHASVGAGTVVVDGHTYLVSFEIGGTYYPANSIYPTQITELKDASGPTMLGVTVVGDADKLLQVIGTDKLGAPFKRFVSVSGGDNNPGFIGPAHKNPDGSFSLEVTSSNNPYIRLDYPVVVAFSLPFLGPVQQHYGDRDPALEAATGVSPLYHRQTCPLEETYADIGFYAYPSSAASARGVLRVSIQTGAYPMLNITTAQSGYAPEDWGKVLERITPAQFREKAALPGNLEASIHSEMRTIDGTPLKVVGPYGGKGWCNDRYLESANYEYQAVKGNAVVTFEFREDPTKRDGFGNQWSAADSEKVVAEVLRTLTITPN